MSRPERIGGSALGHEIDLGPYGAPGHNFIERVDFSGHANGRTHPHVNCEVQRDNGSVVGITRDMVKENLPGFDRMQVGLPPTSERCARQLERMNERFIHPEPRYVPTMPVPQPLRYDLLE